MKFNSIEEIIKRSQYFDENNKELIKNEGVVFTGKEICDQIIEHINPKITETVCEPSVGRGSFVFSLLEKFRKKGISTFEIKSFIENNLYCYDINPEFISELKCMLISYLSILGIEDELNLTNIRCEDFLIQSKKWDVILGNPPYVRIQNLNKDYLDLLKKDLKSVTLGNIDLYYAFLEKSLKSSNRLGFIIPNSFIKTKSGKFLRQIIKDNVSYIYDFCSNKIWDKISTYTCIVVCDNNLNKSINYVTAKNNVIKSKSELSDEKWVFIEQKNGDNKLNDMINYCSGGLATIKDNIYKIDKFDTEYCYKGENKIEYGICKKVIKATKEKRFDTHKWIIYPYDQNGKILSEKFIGDHYPLAYQYLLKSKKDLEKRDKGKTEKYDSWYAYGRRQGLMKAKSGRVIILPITFLRSRGIHFIEVPENNECVVLSGILIDIKEECFDIFIETVMSEHFYNYCEANNKTLKDTNGSDDLWLSITTTTLRNYMF
jgi:adenine-specific DNA-methyltransferase